MQQTGCWAQLVPDPTPLIKSINNYQRKSRIWRRALWTYMTVMGVQVRPTSPVMPVKSIPRRVATVWTAESVWASPVVWQQRGVPSDELLIRPSYSSSERRRALLTRVARPVVGQGCGGGKETEGEDGEEGELHCESGRLECSSVLTELENWGGWESDFIPFGENWDVLFSDEFWSPES